MEKNIFASLPLAEQARQLRNPEGKTGLAVAEWLNATNRQANRRAIELLGLEAGHHVLEIGFGNGRTVPDVLAQADGVHYAGIDISPTMVDDAIRFNAAFVAAGRASFHLGSAQRMPFADASFDRVFSTGVIHFWADAAGSLAEVRRVLGPGGVSQMVLAVNRIGMANQPYACATVGMMQVSPNSRNVIPGKVFFTVDFRHPDADTLKRMGEELKVECEKICRERKLELALGDRAVGA